MLKPKEEAKQVQKKPNQKPDPFNDLEQYLNHESTNPIN